MFYLELIKSFYVEEVLSGVTDDGVRGRTKTGMVGNEKIDSANNFSSPILEVCGSLWTLFGDRPIYSNIGKWFTGRVSSNELFIYNLLI